jgi:hypothetical protein
MVALSKPAHQTKQNVLDHQSDQTARKLANAALATSDIKVLAFFNQSVQELNLVDLTKFLPAARTPATRVTS